MGSSILETPAALVAAVEPELSAAHVPLRREIDALRELHALFTRGRAEMRRLSYMDVPRFRHAYLRYHLPLNVARAACVLRQLAVLHPGLNDLQDVVDLGAGPASASLATLLELPRSPSRRFHLHDRSRSALSIGARLLARVHASTRGSEAGTLDVRHHVDSLPPVPSMPRRALIWLAMVLNELELGSRRRLDPEPFLARLAGRLDAPSVVIVVEPALRVPGTRLLQFHDAALASRSWRVVAPCTHQRSCPLLRDRGRSWCHFHFDWRAPRLVTELADPLGLDHRRPFLSFLVLERLPPGGSPSGGDPSRARVIGDPMAVEGGRGVYICRDGRREEVRTPQGRLRRGDLVTATRGGACKVDISWPAGG